MLRMPYPDLETVPPEVKERLADRLPLNIYRMLANAPTLFPGWMDLGRSVLHRAKLDARLRELAILRVGSLSGSAYEVHQHRKIAASVGLSVAKIDGTAAPPDPSLYDGRELLVLRLAEQVVQQVKADDELFASCIAALGRQETLELLISIGFYMMVARVIENTGIEIESGGGPSQEDVDRMQAATASRVAGGVR